MTETNEQRMERIKAEAESGWGIANADALWLVARVEELEAERDTLAQNLADAKDAIGDARREVDDAYEVGRNEGYEAGSRKSL